MLTILVVHFRMNVTIAQYKGNVSAQYPALGSSPISNRVPLTTTPAYAPIHNIPPYLCFASVIPSATGASTPTAFVTSTHYSLSGKWRLPKPHYVAHSTEMYQASHHPKSCTKPSGSMPTEALKHGEVLLAGDLTCGRTKERLDWHGEVRRGNNRDRFMSTKDPLR